ncbi:MAG: phosphodiesterase [Lachnospiraceae bacterium]|nr:phosphodiesterase [Lachnospiraceae bacterium]
MKWLIASDIHGSAVYCDRLSEAYKREQADRLLLLGDLLYHGPRNDLPEGYDPKKVISLLNSMKDRILCVRGNCDTEVDQMVLDFPIMAEYALLPVGNRLIFVTHGHHFHEQNLLPLCEGDILLAGHTHVPKCEEHESYIYMNPGSVSIPKEESWRGYMTLEDEIFIWKNLEGEVQMTYCL